LPRKWGIFNFWLLFPQRLLLSRSIPTFFNECDINKQKIHWISIELIMYLPRVAYLNRASITYFFRPPIIVLLCLLWVIFKRIWPTL
jgi:hypothetical protein